MIFNDFSSIKRYYPASLTSGLTLAPAPIPPIACIINDTLVQDGAHRVLGAETCGTQVHTDDLVRILKLPRQIILLVVEVHGGAKGWGAVLEVCVGLHLLVITHKPLVAIVVIGKGDTDMGRLFNLAKGTKLELLLK